MNVRIKEVLFYVYWAVFMIGKGLGYSSTDKFFIVLNMQYIR